jgi:uncharacterized protein HemX
MTAGEYAGRGRPERISSRPLPTVPASPPASPAEISTVAEIVHEAVGAALADVMESFASKSTTRMRKETRPLKVGVAGLGALVLAAGGWLVSQVGTWQESQRNQWAVEAKQLEQDEAMTAHLAEPHVTPAQITALEARLSTIEGKLEQLLARDDKPATTPKKGR